MRWPAVVLLGVALALWVDALAGGELAGRSVVLVAVATLAALVGARTPLATSVPVVGSVVLLLAVADRVGSGGRFALADDGVFYVVVVAGPAAAGWLLGALRRQAHDLEERRRLLEVQRRTAEAVARADEVDRIDREVGLVLAGSLGAVVDGVRRLRGPDPEELTAVEGAARAALGELRRVLGVLGEPGPDLPPRPVAEVEPPRWERPARAPLDLADLLLAATTIPLDVELVLGDAGPWSVTGDLLAGAGQAAALLVLRRRPLLGVTALMAVASGQSAWLSPLPPTIGWLLPALAAVFLLGRQPAARTASTGLLLAVLGVGAVTLAAPADQRALDGFLPGLVMGVVTWAAGRAVAVREVRVHALRDAGEQLEASGELAVRRAVADQRAQLARELHDVGAHALTVVCLQAAAARTWSARDLDRATSAVAALREVTDRTLVHLRDSLGVLAATDDVLPLESLSGLGRVLGLDVTWDVDPLVSGRLSPEGAHATFRLVQEALTNAARHAGRTHVEVVVRDEGDGVRVEVRDSGRGPQGVEPLVAVPGSGLGLSGTRARVEGLGGRLAWGPDAAGGFSVSAWLPAPHPVRSLA